MSVLLDDLTQYARYWPDDRPEVLAQYLEFVRSTPECCERSHAAGHCTGSAFIVSTDRTKTLLLFHPFLKRWLQPGGHADGDHDLRRVALREASEETGLSETDFEFAPLDGHDRVPLDIDIHPIPARKSEGPHFHYDMRFLLVADPELPLSAESEEMLLEWIPLEQVQQKTDERSVLRLAEKVLAQRTIR